MRFTLLIPAFGLLIGVACVPNLQSSLGDDSGDEEWSWEAPTNTWPTAAPPEGLLGEGFRVGQVMSDFRMPDQKGDEVSLWQFYGTVAVVDISTMWCGPCQALAEDTETTYQAFLGDGFTYVTVLAENLEGVDASTEDLNTWGDYYGITAPIVSDLDKQWSGGAVPNQQYPLVLVVDREMKVKTRMFAPTDEQLREAIGAEFE